MQRQAARFIIGDYSSKDQGCVTRMLDQLKLPSLQDRRKANRLVFFYKVVGGLVPALPSHVYLTPLRPNRRRVAVKKFADYQTDNVLENFTTNNTKCYKPFQCKSDIYRTFIFPNTVVNWNHLDESVVHAKTVGCFCAAFTSRTKLPRALSSVVFNAERPYNVFIQIQIPTTDNPHKTQEITERKQVVCRVVGHNYGTLINKMSVSDET